MLCNFFFSDHIRLCFNGIPFPFIRTSLTSRSLKYTTAEDGGDNDSASASPSGFLTHIRQLALCCAATHLQSPHTLSSISHACDATCFSLVTFRLISPASPLFLVFIRTSLTSLEDTEDEDGDDNDKLSASPSALSLRIRELLPQGVCVSCGDSDHEAGGALRVSFYAVLYDDVAGVESVWVERGATVRL